MAVEYFELCIRLQSRTCWLIYFQNDEDGVLVDGEGHVLGFASEASMREHARRQRLRLKPGPRTFDFDALEQWLRRPMPTADCALLYAAWNLLGDISTSLGEGVHYLGYQRRYQYLQEELLWGCNLPGAWSSDQPYIPEFSEREVAMLAEVLRSGMDLLRTRLRVLGPAAP